VTHAAIVRPEGDESAVGREPRSPFIEGARNERSRLAAVSAQAGQEPPRGASLKPLDQGTVRRALDLALATLASPGCPQVYADFVLPDGGTPQDALERLGIGPEGLLETLVFIDGSREPVCRMGRAVLTTTPGSRVVSVCPGFAQFQIKNPGKSASLMIHESLHALGLGENPPTSNEITQRVERRCWKGAKRVPGKPSPAR